MSQRYGASPERELKAGVPGHPECVTREQYMGWLDAARMYAPGRAGFCVDCLPEYRQQMIKENRCYLKGTLDDISTTRSFVSTVRELRAAGSTWAHVAEVVGTTRDRVMRQLRRAGASEEFGLEYKGDQDLNEIMRLYRLGHSESAIARIMGTTRGKTAAAMRYITDTQLMEKRQ